MSERKTFYDIMDENLRIVHKSGLINDTIMAAAWALAAEFALEDPAPRVLVAVQTDNTYLLRWIWTSPQTTYAIVVDFCLGDSGVFLEVSHSYRTSMGDDPLTAHYTIAPVYDGLIRGLMEWLQKQLEAS